MGELHCLLIVCAKLRSIELDVLRKKMVLCSDVHLARSLSHAWFMQLKRFAIYASASVFQRLMPTSIATRFRRM